MEVERPVGVGGDLGVLHRAPRPGGPRDRRPAWARWWCSVCSVMVFPLLDDPAMMIKGSFDIARSSSPPELVKRSFEYSSNTATVGGDRSQRRRPTPVRHDGPIEEVAWQIGRRKRPSSTDSCRGRQGARQRASGRADRCVGARGALGRGVGERGRPEHGQHVAPPAGPRPRPGLVATRRDYRAHYRLSSQRVV